MNLSILPLAVTMMAGPQELSAIVFLTSRRAVPNSIAFVTAVAVAATVGTALAFLIVDAIGVDAIGSPDDASSRGSVLEYVLVGLLVVLALRNWRNRETIEPPKWLGTLQDAEPARAARVALLLILCMPTDLIVMFTVAANLVRNDASFVEALPFLGATVLIAGLPFLAFLVFGRRAREAMPRVRDWMLENSWAVNIGVCVLFIVLITA
jgi:hypothetical protein